MFSTFSHDFGGINSIVFSSILRGFHATVERVFRTESSRGMGGSGKCVGGVSLHHLQPAAQFHFVILQQLKSAHAMMHSKTSVKGSVVFIWREKGAKNFRDQKVKVAGI